MTEENILTAEEQQKVQPEPAPVEPEPTEPSPAEPEPAP